MKSNTSQQFWAAINYYKLTNRSRLNLLVPYKQFSFSETRNNWPIFWTSMLLLCFNVAIVLFCAGVFTSGKLPIIPTKDSFGKVDYGPPIIFICSLLIIIYSSYKYLKAIQGLWNLAQSRQFDNGFPDEIDL